MSTVIDRTLFVWPLNESNTQSIFVFAVKEATTTLSPGLAPINRRSVYGVSSDGGLLNLLDFFVLLNLLFNFVISTQYYIGNVICKTMNLYDGIAINVGYECLKFSVNTVRHICVVAVIDGSVHYPNYLFKSV